VFEDAGTDLHFAVLGPLEVTRAGERLPLGGRQQRVVLALLLAHPGTVVSVGRFGDAIWGEQTPSGFVTTLQTYVFHLRAVLEPGREHGAPWKVLVTEPGGYRIDTRGSIVDAELFESLVQAGREALGRDAYDEASAELARGLGLWRGEALADVADLGFAVPVAARLEEMRLIAHELRIEAELALGRHTAVLPEIDRLVAEHPLQEKFEAQRMMALYRLGRQAEALAAYRELRRRLDDELGIEPSPPLQRLHQAVLVQDPALDWQPAKATEPALVSGGLDPVRPPTGSDTAGIGEPAWHACQAWAVSSWWPLGSRRLGCYGGPPGDRAFHSARRSMVRFERVALPGKQRWLHQRRWQSGRFGDRGSQPGWRDLWRWFDLGGQHC